MSFQPVILQSGVAGWRFLQRTYEHQITAFRQSSVSLSDTEYFNQKIPSVVSAAQLVYDYRLLSVSLRAFGLGEDVPNKAFVQRVLEDGISSSDAIANRLADTRYRKLSSAFGFGPGQSPNTSDPTAMAGIVDQFWESEFQAAVGKQDDNARVALYAQGALHSLASGGGSDAAKWFQAMGDPPIRKLFEVAFNLPSSFSQIDLDRQLEYLREKTQRFTGRPDFSQFLDHGTRDSLLTRFMAMTQVNSHGHSLSPFATALTLLRST